MAKLTPKQDYELVLEAGRKTIQTLEKLKDKTLKVGAPGTIQHSHYKHKFLRDFEKNYQSLLAKIK